MREAGHIFSGDAIVIDRNRVNHNLIIRYSCKLKAVHFLYSCHNWTADNPSYFYYPLSGSVRPTALKNLQVVRIHVPHLYEKKMKGN